MYVKNKKLKQAMNFSKEHFNDDERKEIFLNFAKKFEAKKEFDYAEKIYVELKMPE